MRWRWLLAFFTTLSTVGAIALWWATASNPHNDVTGGVTGILASVASLVALFGWAMSAHLFFDDKS